jgi:uncharacterized SAM-binding protein YcdF (DUF218 family)
MSRIVRALATSLRVLSYCSLALLLFGVALLLTAGFWLAPPKDPPERSDFLVVLAGGLDRSIYAADLFRDGLAPKVLVSRPAIEQVARELGALKIKLPREENLHQKILVGKGVPLQAIEFFGEGSLSTVEEARGLDRRFTPPARLLVVTSPSHVLRARFALSAALRDRGIIVQVFPTPYEPLRTRWWQSQESARSVILEIAKLAYYFLGGRFFSQDGH